MTRSLEELETENAALRERVREAEDTLTAIRHGEADALVVSEPGGTRVYTLRGADRPYRLLVESMPDGALVLADDGTILFANRRFAALVGETPEKLVHRSFAEFAAAGGQRPLAQLVAAGEGECDLRLRCAAGDERPVHVSMATLGLDETRPRCAIVADLSALEGAAAELARARVAQAILDQAPDAMLVCDAAGDVTEANRAAHLLCDRPPNGMPLWMCLGDEAREPLEALVRAALAGEQPPIERMRARVGDDRQFLLSCGPLYAGTRVIGAVLCCTDTTPQHRVEQALRESERRFRKLANQIPAIVWRTNAAGEPSFLNEWWFRYTGLSLPDTQGSGWLRALDAAELDGVRARWHEDRATGRPHEGELRVRNAAGELRRHMLRVIPDRDARGVVTGWIGTAVDVESMKRLHDELTEADRRKDDFLAMLAHELRNPLAPIRNCVEVLRALGPEEPSVVRARDIIERQVDHMARLLEDLLDMSRITRDQILLRTDLVSLADVVAQAIEAARPQLEAASHALDISLPSEPVVVEGDEARLVQALTNLLSNAAKFTPPGGHVSVTLARTAREATIAVRDDGLGVPPEQQARIFEAFAQGDTDLARSKGGLGIGLALVRKLLDLHQGEVRVESDGAGLGSVFTLALPLARRAGPLRARTTERREADDGTSLRVLIVEDHADAAEALRMHLRLRGHETAVAHDGAAALARVETFAPQIAFVDVGLPGMDGFEVARRLRSHPNAASALLVALTGYGRSEDKRMASEAGFDTHLTKPAPLAAIAQLLDAVAMGARGDAGLG